MENVEIVENLEVTKEDFEGWLKSKTTKALMNVIKAHLDHTQSLLNCEDLSDRAAPLIRVGELRGLICAYHDILDIRWAVVEEMVNEN